MAKKRKIILFFILFGIISVFFLPGHNKLKQLRSKNKDLKNKIEELKKSNVNLKKELFRIKNDPEYAEKVAREELGVVKEGEIIYKFLPPPKEKQR